FFMVSRPKLTCSSLSDQIHQTPPDLFRKQNQTAEIHCSHTIDNYDRILWYKQSVDGSFQLLGYMLTNSANPEPGMAVKMKGGASKGQNCTLILEELHLSSSAVYYCGDKLLRTDTDLQQ
uniref:Immunoglobulin V-set domain-containing protein n=1 Tax=Gouania willdenowi TaxID=441366 RepID=A0A8C5G188_GOUWI